MCFAARHISWQKCVAAHVRGRARLRPGRKPGGRLRWKRSETPSGSCGSQPSSGGRMQRSSGVRTSGPASTWRRAQRTRQCLRTPGGLWSPAGPSQGPCMDTSSQGQLGPAGAKIKVQPASSRRDQARPWRRRTYVHSGEQRNRTPWRSKVTQVCLGDSVSTRT